MWLISGKIGYLCKKNLTKSIIPQAINADPLRFQNVYHYLYGGMLIKKPGKIQDGNSSFGLIGWSS